MQATAVTDGPGLSHSSVLPVPCQDSLLQPQLCSRLCSCSGSSLPEWAVSATEEPGQPTWTAEASRSGAAGTSGPGAKFEELKAQSRRRRRDQDGRPPRRAFTDVVSGHSIRTAAQEDAAPQPSSRVPHSGQPMQRPNSGFCSQDEEERASTSVAPGASNGAVQPDMVTRPPGADGGDGDATIEMLEHFLRDEEMQKLLYQYLPEPMRNKETFDWMLQNPEYRAQLEGMLKQQVGFQNELLVSCCMGLQLQDRPASLVPSVTGRPAEPRGVQAHEEHQQRGRQQAARGAWDDGCRRRPEDHGRAGAGRGLCQAAGAAGHHGAAAGPDGHAQVPERPRRHAGGLPLPLPAMPIHATLLASTAQICRSLKR